MSTAVFRFFDRIKFIGYNLRDGGKHQSTTSQLERVMTVPITVLILNIVGLIGVVAIGIALCLQIQWLGIAGVFVFVICGAIIIGRNVSLNLSYQNAVVLPTTVLILSIIIAVFLKFPDIWVVSCLATCGIVGVISWNVTERTKQLVKKIES